MIQYRVENDLSAEEFRSVLVRSTLGERRPVDEPERLKSMIEHADLIITARDEGDLVGVARSITDFVYCTYLSDLAVDVKYQGQGIGKELIRQTKLATEAATLILLSAPAAVGFYPKIGMSRHEHCFLLSDGGELT